MNHDMQPQEQVHEDVDALFAHLNSPATGQTCLCCDHGEHTLPCTCSGAGCCHPGAHPCATV